MIEESMYLSLNSSSLNAEYYINKSVFQIFASPEARSKTATFTEEMWNGT